MKKKIKQLIFIGVARARARARAHAHAYIEFSGKNKMCVKTIKFAALALAISTYAL